MRALAEKLREHGLNPWLDEEQLRPGKPWQRELEKQIQTIKSAAVIIGKDTKAPWRDMEIDAFLREFVRRDVPVVPVLLETAPEEPELPVFLSSMGWVDFRESEPEPLEQLIWGITGEKPGRR